MIEQRHDCGDACVQRGFLLTYTVLIYSRGFVLHGEGIAFPAADAVEVAAQGI